MIKVLVCDWNKTLFQEAYELSFFSGLIKEVARKHMCALNGRGVLNVFKTYVVCKKLYNECAGPVSTTDTRRESLRVVVEVLNDRVIRGITVAQLETYIEKYSRKACAFLDTELVDLLARVHRDFRVNLFVISSGCKPAIESVLRRARFPFNSVMANGFEIQNGMVEQFKFNIYGNKKSVLQKILSEKQINLENVGFIGDDWEDRECFEAVGFPIVSFYASEVNKNLLAQHCGAFVPKSRVDLEAFIRSNMN